MAKVKVSNQANVIKSLNKQSQKKVVQAMTRNQDQIVDEINSTILSGQSPVKGKRFKQYSEQYADREKDGSRTPVNMYVTGDMLNSLSVKGVNRGKSVSISFASPIAVFHDKLGAGRSKVIRRLLPDPTKGETFKSNINLLIRRILKRAFGS